MLSIPLPDGFKGYVTTAQGGLSIGGYAGFNLADHVGDDIDSVVMNRRRLQELCACPNIQWLHQVHGTDCAHITTPQADAIQADAAFTSETDVALAVLTADCLPIVIWGAGELAVCHAGWRGLLDGVIANTVAGFSQLHGAWVGPAISAPNYEVGPDVWQGIMQAGWEIGLGLYPHDAGKRLLDLAAVAERQMLQLGVPKVTLSGLCTYADERFYSYRRHTHTLGEGNCGRFATLVWRSGEI